MFALINYFIEIVAVYQCEPRQLKYKDGNRVIVLVSGDKVGPINKIFNRLDFVNLQALQTLVNFAF